MKKEDVDHVVFVKIDHHKSGGERIWLSFQKNTDISQHLTVTANTFQCQTLNRLQFFNCFERFKWKCLEFRLIQ